MNKRLSFCLLSISVLTWQGFVAACGELAWQQRRVVVPAFREIPTAYAHDEWICRTCEITPEARPMFDARARADRVRREYAEKLFVQRIRREQDIRDQMWVDRQAYKGANKQKQPGFWRELLEDILGTARAILICSFIEDDPPRPVRDEWGREI